jgi:hypothetical protein
LSLLLLLSLAHNAAGVVFDRHRRRNPDARHLYSAVTFAHFAAAF